MTRGCSAQNDFIKFLSIISDQSCNASEQVLRALCDVEVKTEFSGLLFFDFPIHPTGSKLKEQPILLLISKKTQLDHS